MYEKIANVLLSVVLMSAFLGIFFFTYAAHIEKNIVKNQSEQIVIDLTADLNAVLTPKQLSGLRDLVSSYIVTPNLSKEDMEINENNKLLTKKASLAIITFVVIGLTAVFLLSRMENFSLKDIIIRNMIILFFVAMTEFCFLTYLAQNYITIDSNFVKYKIINTLANY